MSHTVRLIGPTQKAYAVRLIDAAPAAPVHVMKLAEETRNDRQNAKLHAMIDDIRSQVPDMAVFNVEDAKLRFMDALGSELRYLPKLEGEGFFPVGHRTSTLTVGQFAMLVTLLYRYGDERGVIWSDPAERKSA